MGMVHIHNVFELHFMLVLRFHFSKLTLNVWDGSNGEYDSGHEKSSVFRLINGQKISVLTLALIDVDE